MLILFVGFYYLFFFFSAASGVPYHPLFDPLAHTAGREEYLPRTPRAKKNRLFIIYVFVIIIRVRRISSSSDVAADRYNIKRTHASPKRARADAISYTLPYGHTRTKGRCPSTYSRARASYQKGSSDARTYIMYTSMRVCVISIIIYNNKI